MPRAIWNGSISFGLVTIPIKLYNAVSRKTIRFNQIDRRSGSRIKYKKVSAADGEEVPDEEIVKGYEHAKGQYVLVDDEELQAITPKSGRTIDIEAFVDLDDIDPIYYDAAYYAAPADGFEKSYRLLVRAMEDENRVAVARFVRNNKQYLAALRPKGGTLQVSTMVYDDEVVKADEVPEFDGLDDVDVTEAELTMARQLIGSLEADFEPAQYSDTYRDELTELLKRKAAGEEIVAEVAPVDDAKVVDLLAALEASVAAAKSERAEEAPATPKKKKAAKKKAPTKKKAAAKRKSA